MNNNVDDCSRCTHYHLTLKNGKVDYRCRIRHASVFEIDSCPEGVQLPLFKEYPERWGILKEEVRL